MPSRNSEGFSKLDVNFRGEGAAPPPRQDGGGGLLQLRPSSFGWSLILHLIQLENLIQLLSHPHLYGAGRPHRGLVQVHADSAVVLEATRIQTRAANHRIAQSRSIQSQKGVSGQYQLLELLLHTGLLVDVKLRRIAWKPGSSKQQSLCRGVNLRGEGGEAPHDRVGRGLFSARASSFD